MRRKRGVDTKATPIARAVAAIDGNGNAHATTTVYDAANRRIALIDANTHTTTFGYDAGNPVQRNDGTTLTTYTCSAANKLTLANAGGVVTTCMTGFLYDHQRLLQETDDVGGAVSKMYAASTTDEFGDLIGENAMSQRVNELDRRKSARPNTEPGPHSGAECIGSRRGQQSDTPPT